MTIRRPILLLPWGVLLILAFVAAIAAGPAHAAPSVSTDKPDYAPNETVVITGNGFGPGDSLDVVVVRPDGSMVTGDGTDTPGWDTVTANGSGWFTYNYKLDGVVGLYRVEIYASPWNGPESFDIPMATTTFTDFTITSLSINSGSYSTPTVAVSLLVSWSGAGGDATQVRFVNDLSPEGDCSDVGGGVFGPWIAITEDGGSNTDTIPHTLATQTITGLRRVCAEVAQGPLDAPINTLTANDLIFYRVPNPPLTQSCGLDMVIVMDSSGSMSASELATMKSALTFYTGAFLPETPSEIAIVEFDSSATVTQGFTSNETLLNTAINAATSGGTTNWDDALADADSLLPHRAGFPDLVVLASDGNPNTRGGHTHLGHSAAVTSVSEQDAMSWADAEANDIRTDGGRIITLGIGDGLDTNNLITVSGPVVSPPALIDVNVDVITTGFATLAFALAELADALCEPTIEVQKIIDADGILGTTGDQSPGPNFTFSTNVDAPDFSTPASGDTNGSGSITFTINTGANDAAVVDIIEAGEAGYTFISASCTKPDGPDAGTDPDPVGTPGFMVVNNLAVVDLDVITCRFYNTAPPADPKITAQTTTAPPTATSGTTFVIGVQKTLHNNGPATPVPVIITPTVMAPPDCIITPNGGNPTGAVLPFSVPTPVTELFNATCSQPSSHQFTVINCIQIDPVSGLTDSNPANNCWPAQIVNVNILGQSDIKVQSVIMTSQASANAGSPFPVSASANIHNNGPTGPTIVDTTFTLTMPGDCTTVSPNPQTIQNAVVGVSLVAAIGPNWTVTCTNPSTHSFTTKASAVIDQLHLTDPNGGNNSLVSGPQTTNILVNADLKVTAAATSLPPSVTAGTPFPVNGTATLHNNGPFGPVTADTALTLLLPPDCTTGSPNPATVQNTVLPTSTGTPVGAAWSVTCTSPSSHDFRTMATVTIDQLHVLESNNGNNTMTSATATTAVNATSDIKVTTVSVVSPPTFGAYAPFNVTGQATLHNNGPTGPTNVDTTLTLTMPGDCTTSSTNPQVVNNTSLPVSVATLVPAAPATWAVTCTNPGPHTLSVGASVVVDQLHVVDPIAGNNANTGNDTTDIIPAFIIVCKDVIPNDSSVWDFSATGPSPGNINDLGDGQCGQFGTNMIPGSYTVSETFQGGYAQSVDCGANGFQNDGDIIFTLDPAEQVTCQYVNAFHPGPNPVGGIAGLIEDDDGGDARRRAAETGAGGSLLFAAMALSAGAVMVWLAVRRRAR